MKYSAIIRLRHNKNKEVRKICEDFKKTSESKGEKFIYNIKDNVLEITGCKDVKHAYRIRFWFEKKLPELVTYSFVKKIGESNDI